MRLRHLWRAPCVAPARGLRDSDRGSSARYLMAGLSTHCGTGVHGIRGAAASDSARPVSLRGGKARGSSIPQVLEVPEGQLLAVLAEVVFDVYDQALVLTTVQWPTKPP